MSPTSTSSLILYRKVSNVAIDTGKSLPTGNILAVLADESFQSLLRPNLFNVNQLTFKEFPTMISGTGSVVTSSSRTALRVVSNNSGAIDIFWRFKRSDFIDSILSATISVDAMNSGTSGLMSIVQRDVGVVTIGTTTISNTLINPITSSTDFSINSVPILSSCVYVDLRIQIYNSSTLNRTVDVSKLCIRSGTQSGFTQPNEALARVAALETRANDIIFPNIFTDPIFTLSGTTFNWDNNRTTPISTVNGFKCAILPASTTAVNYREMLPVSTFASGVFSCSLIIHRKLGIHNSTALRIRLTAHATNDANVIMNGVWSGYSGNDIPLETNYYSKLVPTTDIISATTIVVCSGIPIPVGATYISIDIRSENAPEMCISHITLCEGKDPTYREKIVTSDGGEVVDPTTEIMTKLSTEYYPNSWPDPQFKKASGSFLWDSGRSTDVVVKNGYNTTVTPSSSTAINIRKLVPVSTFASNKFSASLIVHEKIGDQGALGLRVRLTAHTSSAQGPIITNAWAGYPAGDMVDNTFYTKLVPTTDITSPQTIVICEGFNIPVGATHIGIDIRIQTTVQMYFSHVVVCEGLTSLYRDSYLEEAVSTLAQGSTTNTQAVVKVTGNDTTGTGTSSSPFATINRALTSISGSGTILLEDSEYTQNQRINPLLVKGKVTIIGKHASGRPTIIRVADKLIGVTKTANQNKVYQVAVTGLTRTPNWIYEDGVNDETTIIANGTGRPEHNGRTHRMYCCKINKATSTTLSAALTEMDASNAPLCFWDNNILYFTIQGGGDATLSNLYLDNVAGLIDTAPIGSCGSIELRNLDVRYGGVNTRPFRSAHLASVKILGSRVSCWDYAYTSSFSMIETCAAGSATTDATGDGVNGHDYSELIGHGVYSHDNMDDGESTHEHGRVRMYGGLFENNGGTAVAPAYGCDAIYYDVVSISNQRVLGRKAGAFSTVGAPLDGGTETLAYFIRCTSITDRVSFNDSSQTGTSRAVCIDCTSINPTTTAYDVSKIINCRHLGTGTAKSNKTIVENSNIVI